MISRYMPGERHLQLAGEFARYYKAAEEIFLGENITDDEDLIFSFAEHAFFTDLETAANLNALYVEHHLGGAAPLPPEEDGKSDDCEGEVESNQVIGIDLIFESILKSFNQRGNK